MIWIITAGTIIKHERHWPSACGLMFMFKLSWLNEKKNSNSLNQKQQRRAGISRFWMCRWKTLTEGYVIALWEVIYSLGHVDEDIWTCCAQTSIISFLSIWLLSSSLPQNKTNKQKKDLVQNHCSGHFTEASRKRKVSRLKPWSNRNQLQALAEAHLLL